MKSTAAGSRAICIDALPANGTRPMLVTKQSKQSP